jgi:yersiniabactin nonribosomal peptide synthetase
MSQAALVGPVQQPQSRPSPSFTVDVPCDHEGSTTPDAPALWTFPVPAAPGRDRLWWTAVFAAFVHRYSGASRVTVLDGGAGWAFDVADDTTVGALRAGAVRVEVPAESSRQHPVSRGVLVGTAGSDADLTLGVVPDGVQLSGRSARWSADSVRRMACHLGILAAAAADDSAAVAGLPMLDPADRHRLLVAWNDTTTTWPGGGYLDLVAAQAAERPDAVALVAGERVVRYAELAQYTDRIAHRLAALGAGPGTRVGLLAARGAEYVLGVLGTMKAGAAVVPLDPANPDARIAFMLGDSAPVVVLVTPALAGRLPIGTERVLTLEDPLWTEGPADPPVVELGPDSVTHLIYTSGSTGEPKAVLERYRALGNLVHWTARAYGVVPDDRASWLSTPGFAVQFMELMPYLGIGAAVHIGLPGETDTPRQVRDWLVRHGITHTMLVAALAERAWQLDWPADAALRVMVTTAERVHTWPPADRSFRVVMTYGSTETTNVLSCLDLGIGSDLTTIATPAEVRAARPVPAGRPIANLRVYLLDAAGQPVPVGVVGRLHVAGAGLAAGYHDRPELTAAKFRPNPLPEEPEPVLYDSGDLARFRADGAVEIVGRTDAQVKIRGHRVEIGEVESAVAALPGVREAVVVARTDVSNATGLVAYLAGADLDPAVLAAALAVQLPQYMVPGAFVVLDGLPRLANGKTDLRALPEPQAAGQARRDAGYVAPRTGTERRLAALWARALGVERVGIEDGFFDLGGHSLLAFRLIDEIRRGLGVEVSLPDLMRRPTVAALATLVEERDGAEPVGFGGVPAARPDPAARFEPFPLNDSQQALWIGRGDAVELGNVGCHGYFEWESPDLDVARFRVAWQRVVDRHDALRSVIRADGTQQVLIDAPPYDIPVVDLRDAGPEQVRDALAELRERLSHAVMAEDKWPLVDVRLSLLPSQAPGEHRVRIHLSIDMLIADAWSYFQVLVPDLVQYYEEPDGDLPPLELTFRDYVLGLEEGLPASEIYHRSQRYWMQRIADLPPAPQLPARPAWQDPLPVKFDRVDAVLDAERWSRLKAHANGFGVTPSGVLTAVFAEVLRRWTGQPRFTINFPLFNRIPVHPDVNRIIGDTTTTLLVAVERADGTFAQRAQALQQQLWADLEHRFFSGVQVLRELARLRGSVAAAMPVVLTSLLGHPPRRYATSLGDAIYSISQTPQVSIDFQIFEIAGELQFNWDFLPALFPDRLVEDMFDAYCSVLHDLADDPDAWQRAAFDLLPRYQRERQAAVNDTAVPVREVLLHEVLAERAAERPDTTALVTTGRRMSYAELDRRAGHLGHRLRDLGAVPGALVAIVMRKGWEQVVAVYGTLAAGAAYLPVDASVPAARLHRLLDSGQVDIVVTQPGLLDTVDWPDRVREIVVVEPEAPDGPVAPLPSVQRPTDLAYVLFTSGSTGEPKGVMVDHRGVVNHIDDVNRRLGAGSGSRPGLTALGTAALHFDMSVYDVFGVLAAGGTLVLPDPADGPDPGHWLDLVRAERVTFWAAVPPLMDLAVGEAERRGTGDMATVRDTVLAGDWIPLTLPDRLRAVAPSIRINASGGPTETINWSIWYEVGQVDPRWTSVPYGWPMANHRYHIIDGTGQVCPDWVPGEMFDASEVGLAHGYWRDPDRTAASFVTLESGERAYATGDLGRTLPDGSIEILGRADFQVKVQGHRIELGEIESALRGHPAVRAAVVVAVGAHAQRHLVAHVELREPVAEQALQDHLSGLLPAPTVPRRYRVHERLPLSANGKLDRKALAELPDAAPARPVTAPAREADPLDLVVASVWQDVLQVPVVTPDARFFDLGGNSMLAALLARKVSELFEIELSLRAVFDLATVADMADALRAHPERGAEHMRRAEELAGRRP